MNYTELENPLSSQSEVERGERTTNHRLGGRALDRVDGAWLWLSLSFTWARETVQLRQSGSRRQTSHGVTRAPKTN